MTPHTFRFFFLFSTFSVAIPLTFYYLRIKDQPKQNAIIAAFLGFSFLSDMAIWISSVYSVPTFVLNNIYTIVTFILLSLFYYKILFEKKAQMLIYAGSCIYGIGLIYFASSNGFGAINTAIWVLSALVLTVYAFLYLWIIPNMTIDRYLDKFLFSNIIINSTFKLFFCASVTISLFIDFVFTHLSPDNTRAFWSIHNIINILKNVGIASAFFLSGKRKPYISLTQLEKMNSEKTAG